MSSRITTHVLYLASGRPAAGLGVSLGISGSSTALATTVTDQDGRIAQWEAAGALDPGDYWLRFDTGAWFAARNEETFYPRVEVCFAIDGASHYHVPLLLSPFGYSTYRGS